MIPFAISAFFIPNRLKGTGGNPADDTKTKFGSTRSINSTPNDGLDGDESTPLVYDSPAEAQKGSGLKVPTFWSQVKACITTPIFVCIILGYASWTASIAGLSFYVPLFIQTNRPCDTRWRFPEAKADFIFGAIVASTGFLGTAVGGYLLDWQQKGSANTQRERLRISSQQITWQMLVGTAICITAVFMDNPVGFFGVIAIGCFMVFTTTAGTNLVINWSVPPENRSMAVALSILTIHALGDVPSPIIIGYMADHLPPTKNYSGAQRALALTLGWLVWACLFWGLCWVLAWRMEKKA